MFSYVNDLSGRFTAGNRGRIGSAAAIGGCLMGLLTAGSVARYLHLNSAASRAERRRARSLKVVVVTGCDSGFGRMACETLAQEGYFVIATCLTKNGIEEISSKVQKAFICDVTRSEDVLNLATECQLVVSSMDGGRLYGVVNNAGVGIFGLIDYMSMKTIRFMMEVNYFGLVAVTKALLPLLKKSSPGCRIVNISSVAGLVESALFGPYAASKHAVEGFTKSLRQELLPWGIRVCNINPAIMKTPMADSAAQQAIKEFRAAPDDLQAQYSTDDLMRVCDRLMATADDPRRVVDSVVAVMEEEKPSMWNFPGICSQLVRMSWYLPKDWGDFLKDFSGTLPHPTPEGLRRARS